MSYGIGPLFVVCLLLTLTYLFVSGLELAKLDERAGKVRRTLATFYGIEVDSVAAKLLVAGGPATIELNGRVELIRLAESGPDDIRFRREDGVLLQTPV